MRNDVSYWSVILIAAVVISFFFAGRYIFFCQKDISKFILLDRHYVNKEELVDQSVYIYDTGYDGQFYYRYAIDPFSLERIEYGIKVDNPKFRRQRIVFPLLSWILSAGEAKWVPWSMIVINLLAFLGIFIVLLKILSTQKVSLVNALYPILIVGFWMSLSRNTPEIIEGLFLSLSLYAIIRNKWWQYALFASLTVLSREGAIILLGGGSVALTKYAWQTKKLNPQLLVSLLTPLVVFVGHRYMLEISIPGKDFPSLSQYIFLPFTGIQEGVALNWSKSRWVWPGMSITLSYFLGLIVLAAIITQCLLITIQNGFVSKNRRLILFLQGAIVAWSVFLLSLGIKIFAEDWGFIRISSSFFLMAFLFLLLKNGRLKLVHLVVGGAYFALFTYRAWYFA